MRCRMIERRRNNEAESRTKREGKRGLGFWRYSSLCINIIGSHHVSSSRSPILIPGNINFIIFSPIHSTLFIILRARGPRGATRFCHMSQLVMRFSVLLLPRHVTTLMHARVVLYFSWESLDRTKLSTTQFAYNRNYVVDEAVMFT